MTKRLNFLLLDANVIIELLNSPWRMRLRFLRMYSLRSRAPSQHGCTASAASTSSFFPALSSVQRSCAHSLWRSLFFSSPGRGVADRLVDVEQPVAGGARTTMGLDLTLALRAHRPGP
jgi:hypothetical protein